MNYVYLIQSTENSYYKIGVSKSPNIRIKQLNTGNPSPTKLIEAYPSEKAYQIEKILHRMYSHLKIENKEWFDLSIKEEVSFLSECLRIENNLKFLVDSGNCFINNINN